MRISDWSSDVCSSDLDALRAAFDDGGRDAAAGDVGEALGGEHYRDILLAQRLQPSADARGSQRMVEEDPGLVEDQQRRPAVESLLEPVEQNDEHRRVNARTAEQRLGLEAFSVGQSAPALRGHQNPTRGSKTRSRVG